MRSTVAAITASRGSKALPKGEGDLAAQTQYLRDQDDYSVLLAYFRNEAQGLDVTLAQVCAMSW